jgi:V/A-type H+-transporting ATPase subunit C
MSPAVASARDKRAKSNDYGYSNARLRGMRARLLRRERLENLLGLTDFPQLIQELMQTELQPFLEQTLIHGRNAASIDEALKLNLIATYRKVLGFLNTEADDICTTLLGRWDTFNLKTILRGKHLHLTAAEIAEGLLPVGALSQVDLDGLSGQGDVKAVVDLAATWGLPQAAAMRAGFSQYQESGELADLELAVDRFYAEWASKRLSRRKNNYQVARSVLGMQVDILNLVMVFRAARENLDAEQSADYFLLGGLNIELSQYQRLAAMSDVDEILDGLRGTPYGQLLDETALSYLEDLSIAVFERALEDYFTRKVIALGNRDPLGIGIPIGYLWAKQNEVTNLRIIVKGVAVGMPAERMRKELILV